ncbi:glycosyltransferase [Streptococcus ovuberis]|uniref:Glycosyltransferase family 2 protein n=1 Tax=Streptococcus ovuberis TaxID=1936207 RepID=A0A7X6MVZ0_9STRE|nr:glycosyltransferase [Streptococcus ovuberis]NKZ19375.1 glycosyltransferase family 2 protein [Streptococcus ovuberis]
MPKVAHVVVVLAYNDNQAVKEYLEQTLPLPSVDKVILVDNCSTTGLYQDLRTFITAHSWTDKVDCLQTTHNGGYAFGNNVGLRYAIEHYQPTYISLSNADITLNEEALQACMTALANQENLAFVAPKMISQRPEKASWPVPTYWDLVGDNLILLRGLMKHLKPAKEQASGTQEVGVLAGSYYMGRAETFADLGFLDERTFLYGEENILGFKVRRAGMINQIIHDVHFTHHHSTSINTTIQSVGRRLDILKASCHIYLKHYLNCRPWQMALFDASHLIGKVTYLGVKLIRDALNA